MFSVILAFCRYCLVLSLSYFLLMGSLILFNFLVYYSTTNFQLVRIKSYEILWLFIVFFVCLFFTNFFIFFVVPLIEVFSGGGGVFFWVWIWFYHSHRCAFFYAIFCYFFNIFVVWCGDFIGVFLSFILLFYFLFFLYHLVYSTFGVVGHSLWVV